MAKSDKYLVPIDFSRGSEKALDYAFKLARDTGGTVIALHVLAAANPPSGVNVDFFARLERDANEKFRELAKRKRLKPDQCRFVLDRGTDYAEVIARQARKVRARMIVMGSHGRTGLQRLLLGSVAERTLRYSTCPVLIVK